MTLMLDLISGEGNIFWLAFTSFLLYLASLVIYRLFFHPLRNYPAPFLSRISDLPFIWNRSTGRQHLWTDKIHMNYGPIVRLAPWYISYTEPSAWRDITGPKIYVEGSERGGIPRDFAGAFPAMGGTKSLVWAFDGDHPRMRKIMSPAFSDKARGEQEPCIRKYVDLMVNKLIEKIRSSKQATGHAAATVNLVDSISFATFDIIHDLCYGTDLGMTGRDEWVPWMSGIFTSLQDGVVTTALTATFPLFVPVIALLTPRTIVNAVSAHMQISGDRMEERAATEVEHPDFWTYIQRAIDKYQKNGDTDMKLSQEEIRAFGQTFMIAGTETSATVISGLIYLLSANQRAYEKLVTEIREQFNSPADINMASVASLPWMNACINESLRLYPPALGLPRIVGQGGRIICGRWVPQGATVHVPHFNAYRLEANFAHPLEFRPERWLSDEPGNEVFRDDQREVFQPFGFGPRNCIGKSFALNETRLLIATLFWHLDVHATPANKDWLTQRNFQVFEKKPLFVKLTEVEHTKVLDS